MVWASETFAGEVWARTSPVPERYGRRRFSKVLRAKFRFRNFPKLRFRWKFRFRNFSKLRFRLKFRFLNLMFW